MPPSPRIDVALRIFVEAGVVPEPGPSVIWFPPFPTLPVFPPPLTLSFLLFEALSSFLMGALLFHDAFVATEMIEVRI